MWSLETIEFLNEKAVDLVKDGKPKIEAFRLAGINISRTVDEALKDKSKNGHYANLVDITVRLHELIKEGKDDSEEADALRDASDISWRYVSESERKQLQEFSENHTLPATHSNLKLQL